MKNEKYPCPNCPGWRETWYQLSLALSCILHITINIIFTTGGSKGSPPPVFGCFFFAKTKFPSKELVLNEYKVCLKMLEMAILETFFYGSTPISGGTCPQTPLENLCLWRSWCPPPLWKSWIPSVHWGKSGFVAYKGFSQPIWHHYIDKFFRENFEKQKKIAALEAQVYHLSEVLGVSWA